MMLLVSLVLIDVLLAVAVIATRSCDATPSTAVDEHGYRMTRAGC